MTQDQIKWFRQELSKMLDEVEQAIEFAVASEAEATPDTGGDEGDMAERRLSAAQAGMLQDRLHRKRREIVMALARIESGEYGYCEDTGDEIGIARLRANPVARYSIEAQQLRERADRMRAP